jgi:phosphatidyl-myo-inositol dimannoside synthase
MISMAGSCAPLRVLVVTRNFPPLWGGMERLNLHLAAELAGHAQVRVVAPLGAAARAPAGVAVAEVPLRPLGRFLAAAGWRAIRVARGWRPHVVLAGSGLTAPLALAAARSSGARAAAYVHGLDLTVRHPAYRAAWLPALRRMDRTIANSGATAALAASAGMPLQRLAVVHPGVTLPDVAAAERARVRAAFRAEHGLGSAPVLLSVGRLTTRKGLVPFVRDVLPAIVRAHPQVRLLIVGDVPRAALAAQVETVEEIRAAARGAGVADCVIWLGPRFGAALAAAFYAADVHVFPVRELPGDPEGFGMVAVEAAAHGVPTVAYATGGVVDAVEDGASGVVVPPGDAGGFARAVMAMLERPPPPAALRSFAQRFEWSCFGERVAAHLFPDSPT